MRKSLFSVRQIVMILKDTEAGLSISNICRVNGISLTTYCKWMTKCGCMEASDVRRLKELQAELKRIKLMYAT